jgi:restriction system protein
MPIPDFQSIMLPLLRLTADGQEHTTREFVDKLAMEFALSEEEQNTLLPSGKQPLFYNRVGWARTYLTKTRLMEMSSRAHYRITDRGKLVLSEAPPRIDMKYLSRYPEYREFHDREAEPARPKEISLHEVLEIKTPEENLGDAYQRIRNNLAQELLSLVKQCSPSFFERLVVELLVEMGYGGSHSDAARAVGQVGDEGIDGIIDEDRLGLDTIYIQAKKWETNVSRPEIQKFVGALAGKRAKKGIFITTANFTNEAINYVATVDSKIVLIDGKRLADLMIDYNIGVTTMTTYQLKRVDSDYFILE